MRTYTLTGCLALLGDPPTASDGPVDIVVAGNRIREVRPAGVRPPEGEAIEASGRLATAGLINGHTHSHENFHKGRYENQPLEVWMNYVRPPDGIAFTPRQAYLRTLVGAIEALRSGCTCVVDDLNLTPLIEPAVVDAVFQAYEDAGIRAFVSPGMFDKPFFSTAPFVAESFPKDLLDALAAKPRSTPAEVYAFVEGLMAERCDGSRRVSMGVSPSAPQRCTEEFLQKTRRLADRFAAPVIVHVQETRLQVVSGRMFYGSTMLEYLERAGFLAPGVSVIHGVWLNPREIELLARSGASLQHNPTSNFALGSGLCPLREVLDGGVNVSLGTDACGSSVTVNMLKVVNGTALVQKLRGDDYTRWIGAAEAWRAGTVGGAVALGLGGELGQLAAGYRADIALYRLDSIAFQPLGDPLRQLVYAEHGASLDTMIVDGAFVMRGGRLASLDEPAILQEIAEEHARLKPALDRADATVAPMARAYDAIYRRCLAEPVAADTYPARFA